MVLFCHFDYWTCLSSWKYESSSLSHVSVSSFVRFKISDSQNYNEEVDNCVNFQTYSEKEQNESKSESNASKMSANGKNGNVVGKPIGLSRSLLDEVEPCLRNGNSVIASRQQNGELFILISSLFRFVWNHSIVIFFSKFDVIKIQKNDFKNLISSTINEVKWHNSFESLKDKNNDDDYEISKKFFELSSMNQMTSVARKKDGSHPMIVAFCRFMSFSVASQIRLHTPLHPRPAAARRFRSCNLPRFPHWALDLGRTQTRQRNQNWGEFLFGSQQTPFLFAALFEPRISPWLMPSLQLNYHVRSALNCKFVPNTQHSSRNNNADFILYFLTCISFIYVQYLSYGFLIFDMKLLF